MPLTNICNIMPAVHSHRVHLARVARDETASATLYSCWELSIHERWEQGEDVQTRARARRACTDKSENKARVGEGCSHVCWLKWVGYMSLLPIVRCWGLIHSWWWWKKNSRVSLVVISYKQLHHLIIRFYFIHSNSISNWTSQIIPSTKTPQALVSYLKSFYVFYIFVFIFSKFKTNWEAAFNCSFPE